MQKRNMDCLIQIPFHKEPIKIIDFQQIYYKIFLFDEISEDWLNKYWILSKEDNIYKLKDGFAEDEIAIMFGFGNQFIMDIYYKPGRKFADNEYIIIPKPFENEPITIRMFKRKYKYFAETFDGTTAESFMSEYWKPYSSDKWIYGIVYGFIDVDKLKLVKELLSNYEKDYGEKFFTPGLTKKQSEKR
jgi:hypothetical protein